MSTTHCRPPIPPPRSWPIVGNATFTTTASSVTMKKPNSETVKVAADSDTSGGLASLPTASTPAVVIVAFLTPHEQAEFDYPLRFYYSSKRMLDVRLA